MFPIIPQYMVAKATVSGIANLVGQPQTGEPKGLKKVVEKNDETECIEVAELFSQATDAAREVSLFSSGNILKATSKNWSWLKNLPFAEHCQSHNLELSIAQSRTSLQLRAVRRILPDEKLILWFSRDLLMFLQIPYLTPSNIRGGTQYVCNKCSFQCEMPNPLKIHLALDCGRRSREHLWLRLKTLDQNAIRQEINGPCLQAQIKSENQNSAFKPYRKSPLTDPQCDAVDDLMRIGQCSMLPSEVKMESLVIVPAELNQSVLYKQAAEMEAIVSNLGRFKQGHLCIYCGKVYSRKYGLKIHIRTHTGFKPLKCKVCSRPFGDPSNLNKHVRLHSEKEAPYKCEQCGKLLVRRRDLERHLKSRHCII